MNIFSSDGWFTRIFGTLGDIILVNILFIICSLPVFTIGASMSGMYYALMRKQRTDDGGIAKLFFKGFKDNFKQGTGAWLLYVVISFVFSMDFRLFGEGGPQENKLMYYASVVMFVLVSFIAIYLFPVIAAFENKLKDLILQSIYLAARNIIFTVIIMILYTMPVYVLISNTQMFMVGIFVFIVCGFGLIAYISSMLFLKAFSPFLEDVTKVYSDDDPENWLSTPSIGADDSSDSKAFDIASEEKAVKEKSLATDIVTDKSDGSTGEVKDPRKVTKKLTPGR